MKRQNILSDTKWENIIGYSRAVRIGNLIEVTGTAAVDGDKIIGKGNPYEQTRFIIKKIEAALKEAGAELKNVIRTRIYVTDISIWKEVGKAHSEFFGDIKPATSLLAVKALIEPELLVEIEATAIVDG